MLDIPEPVAVICQQYSVITVDKFDSPTGNTLPPECAIVFGQVPMLRIIDLEVTEKGCWIKGAKANLDDNELEKQRSQQKRDVCAIALRRCRFMIISWSYFKPQIKN